MIKIIITPKQTNYYISETLLLKTPSSRCRNKLSCQSHNDKQHACSVVTLGGKTNKHYMNVIKAGHLQPVAACCGIFNVDCFCALMLPLFPQTRLDSSTSRSQTIVKAKYLQWTWSVSEHLLTFLLSSWSEMLELFHQTRWQPVDEVTIIVYTVGPSDCWQPTWTLDFFGPMWVEWLACYHEASFSCLW